MCRTDRRGGALRTSLGGVRVIARFGPSAALAGLGALVVHQLAYLLASALATVSTGVGGGPVTDHGHLTTMWAVATPLAVIAAACFVLRQIRDLGYRTPLTARAMTAGISGVFVAQEAIEYALAGISPLELASSPAIWIGLLLALPVAFALRGSLRQVSALVARFVERRATIDFERSSFGTSLTMSWQPVLLVVATPTRGPPRRVR